MPFIPGFQSKPWAGISQRFERINCSTARHAEKPAGHVIDRHQQAIGFYQFVEDLRRCLRRPKGRSRRLAVARPVREGLAWFAKPRSFFKLRSDERSRLRKPC